MCRWIRGTRRSGLDTWRKMPTFLSCSRGLICKAAGNSPQSSGLPKPSGTRDKAQEVSHGLSEFETPFLQVRHLALAARMMGSSDDMPKEAGLALDAVADRMIDMMDELSEERHRLWKLSREVAYPE